MAGKEWSVDEIQYLKDNFESQSCQEMAKVLGRTMRSTQHKFGQLGLERRKASIGDVVNGWLIVDIFIKDLGSQNVSYAKLRSTLGDETEREERLTKLTLAQIGWPDRRRPDVILKNTTHGSSNTRLYSIWNGMKNRCKYKNGKQYKDYGGRGIKVCNEWQDFTSFKSWAEKNGYSDKLTLDRVDVDGDYEPNNCQWSTWLEQSSNKRNSIKMDITAFNETMSVYEWAADIRCPIDVGTLVYRINAGWNPEEAITKPSERKSKLPFKEWVISIYPDIEARYEQYKLL